MMPSLYPCPICKAMMCVVGITKKGEKMTSCGHKFKFKRTKSKKDMDKKYRETPWGLELITNE